MTSSPTSDHSTRELEAERSRSLPAFRVMQLLARAKALEAEGRSIIHMEVGEPDFPTPPAVVEAGVEALRRGCTGYTPALGISELRQAIAREYYGRRLGIEVPADHIAVTPGASGALQLALAATVDPGEEVLLTEPGYPCNANFVRVIGAKAKALPVEARHGFQPTVDSLRAHLSERTRMLMLASPANPTGAVLERQRMEQLLTLCRERGVVVLVDEIYHLLVYGRTPFSALELDPNVLVVNSFSKYFQMTGWRIGWLVMPQPLVSAVDRLAQNLFLAPSTPAQYAALAALGPDVQPLLEERRQLFERRRAQLSKGLTELGFKIPAEPAGAFYIYVDASAHTEDAEQFAHSLLEQQGVAITPGTDFGGPTAATYLRFAYTQDEAVMAEALRRIADFVRH